MAPTSGTSTHRRGKRGKRGLIAGGLVLIVAAGVLAANIGNAADLLANVRHGNDRWSGIVQSLDGRGNNPNHPSWGQANQPYSRVGSAHYADGVGAPETGPNARAVSNRIIGDHNQNVFSERRVTQWGWTWGQFLDHTFGLRESTGPTATPANIPVSTSDPLEPFRTDIGAIVFTRSAASPGTGTNRGNPRQQTNTLPSFISGNPIYGATNQRLDWLRDGSQDGNPANNRATLMLADGYLPRKTARGNPATAPAMDVDGRLLANPNSAVVAGDARANENIALTATHTLFAREHNRIVGLLPDSLSQEDKFQIARRVVIAEQQFITYQEFLPALGVTLPAYTGYKSNVNTTLSNEFATVGYRAHSQIHGEFEVETEADTYSAAQLEAFEDAGVEVSVDGDELTLAMPLGLAFFNPDLLKSVGLGEMLHAIGAESQYNNDENIDNQLRSTLFQVPVAGNTECLDGPTMPECFTGINDLGAIDIERSRDHGIGTYNQLRQAYGLAPKRSFTSITGESTDAFPADPMLTKGNEINDPNLVDVMEVFDLDGKEVDQTDEVAMEGTATRDVRRTSVAARLKAVYGDVNKVDAFTGMIAEQHVAGSEFGELQLAIWTREFQRLRDGDRFFYGNDQGLSYIRSAFGVDFHRTLAQVIAANTDVPAAELNDNVFLTPDDDLPATTCAVTYTTSDTGRDNRRDSDQDTFRAALKVTNNGTAPVTGWALKWQFANGQRIRNDNGARVVQNGPDGREVTVSNNSTIPPGGTVEASFTASWDGTANARPPSITLNGSRCAVSS